MGYYLEGYGFNFFAQQSNENFVSIASKHILFYHIRTTTNTCYCNFTLSVTKTRLIPALGHIYRSINVIT
ncbi:hypothetical protein A4R26_21220 [Niastella populi]|uniref:Uncharacterized protein n=1 Tax=Niastella populi TaxID=550983 RepID=A0A1V9FLW7_9BACT|nr:hypothetical protein A4R26_21220 [Niastella populi]